MFVIRYTHIKKINYAVWRGHLKMNLNYIKLWKKSCTNDQKHVFLWIMIPDCLKLYAWLNFEDYVRKTTGFEIRRDSASLTGARTRRNHSTRVFSDSRWSFVRLSSSNDNFHKSLILNNSNTFIFHFFW